MSLSGSRTLGRSSSFSGAAILLLCLASAPQALLAQGTPESLEDEPVWGPQESNHYFTVGHAQETDPGGYDLDGWRVATGVWGEVGGLKYSLYLMGETGEGQRVHGFGTDVMLFAPWKHPFRLGLPLVRLGVEHRRLDPHDGISGIFGVGTEMGFWIGKSWQVTASVIREFGFPAGTRDEVGINLRWLHPGDSVWDF